MIRVLAFAVIVLVSGSPLGAVEPSEILPDAALEQRARDISKGLRCLVCRNESIDDSNAGLARDLRILVRERLVAGESDAEVIKYVVDRYGEYVLLTPSTSGSNIILWVSGPLMLLFGLGTGIVVVRRNQKLRAEPLTGDEKARLDEILKS